MTRFEELLTASSEDLLKALYRSASRGDDHQGRGPARTAQVARNLGLTSAQLVCALGFNPQIRNLYDIISLVGFDSYDALAHARNIAFTEDIYHELGIKDVLALYQHVTSDLTMLEVMQHLLQRRLESIEGRIESTVNSVLIERYKKEIRAIYNDGVAQIEFAEQRLARTDSGFRALLNEVTLIVESRVLPVGDVFFRDTVLPEEKRRLIMRGLIPRELVVARLQVPDLAAREREVLTEQLALLDA